MPATGSHRSVRPPAQHRGDLFVDAAGGSGFVITLSSLRNSSDLRGLVVSRPLDPTALAPETVMARLATRVGVMREIGEVLEGVAADLRADGVHDDSVDMSDSRRDA